MTICAAIGQKSISGIVTDAEGLALIGANITAKGSSIGTITDLDGNFSLEVPDETTSIVVSYTGYTTQEINIEGLQNVSVILAEGQFLEEVVVTAVGLEANRRSIGYSVQNVDASELLDSKETNIVNALSGKVAGVQVTSSAGSPGASSSIKIRGSVSVNKSNQPLFVVDGVPIDNSTGGEGNGVGGSDQSNRAIDINPNDIASMTVLKGASATALYGVRAANGAIVITTKKGKAGKPVVNISASYGISQVNKLPELQNTYAQGAFNNGVAVYRGPETAEGDSWGPLISDLEFDGDTDYFFDKKGKLVPKGQGNGTPAIGYDPYNFFITGQTLDLNASVAGGTDKVRYYISGGKLSQTGIVPNADFGRTSFRTTLNVDITEKLEASVSANYVNSGGSRIQRGSNINGVMLGLVRNTPTFDIGNGLAGQAAADDVSTYVNPDGSQRSYRWGVYDSPYWAVNKNPTNDDVNRIIGYAGLKYQFTDWLFASYKLGVDTYSERFLSAFDINQGGGGNFAGLVNQRFGGNKDLNSDLILGMNKQVADKFSLGLVVGYNVFDTRYTQQSTTGTTLSAPNFYHISNAADITTGESIQEKRIHGVYGTIDLGYNDWAFLNLTGRNDWSSALPVQNNTYQSYSASLGLAITEALNIQSDFLDYGKLRASYGVIGNDAPIYATSNTYAQAFSGGDGFITGITFPAFGGNAFERSTQLANEELRPEKATTIELGAEIKLFNGRLGADVTWYDTRSEDIIIAVQLPASTGFTTAVQNSGVITNTGWEVVLDAVPVRTKNFRWDIIANFTTYDNIVEELAEGVDDIGLAGFTSTSVDLVPGLPYSVIYGDGFQRADDGQLIIGSDGWPIAATSKQALGDPNPDYTVGLRNSLTYKGVTLSGLLDFRKGGDMWCGTCGIINYFGTSKISADERNDVIIFDGVTAEGTPNTTPVAIAQSPSASEAQFYRRRYGFGGISEMNIHDTSWIRLRELTVKFNITKDVLKNLPIERINVALSGRNLWLSTKYPGIDPETNLTGASNGYGLDYFNMPNTKGYSATVNLTF
ncbi:SusC/RagA family TonB-linked outer membrane protein [Portibacter lacus]|uniref:SusC/RagA family TonB-linked outer membrane protein n=2 Tax=Portibacter lacus TaxID=1099794 RepID=A0AA37SXA4_9BACT|nr:SusC/RagA family TonB-linked outer membrane protein [Portibacter lacus]